ncbi:LacI family transcriptional regulator [Bifidobacterium tissieri]|uniref:LacI family transcriptional regulator n=1 Tax=Bifidobacterium tissieri TaxID=1630162 RepID=A0A261FHV5_9BIFI|nr:LacI family DNA-binding transcriptional regulator [Bifidobacterium tissieri]OZG58740.1 LacI family transcriptional regulator [Bifidobacterium tissieri]
MSRPAKAKRKPSIADVAAAVGVSKTTISRYLHGEYDYMSADTRARIEAVVKELGYRPNKMAQGLKATNSRMIGVTIANISNPFSSQLLKGMQSVCRARGIQLLVSDADDDPALERAAIESLMDSQVDGLIINTVGGNDEFLTTFASTAGNPPIVMLDRMISPIVCDCIVTDNAGAVDMMLDHVRERGFTYAVFVTQPAAGITTRQTRAEAVRAYLATHDLAGEVLEYADSPRDDMDYGGMTGGSGAVSGSTAGHGRAVDNDSATHGSTIGHCGTVDDGSTVDDTVGDNGIVDDGNGVGLAARLTSILDAHVGERICIFANNEDAMCDVFAVLAEPSEPLSESCANGDDHDGRNDIDRGKDRDNAAGNVGHSNDHNHVADDDHDSAIGAGTVNGVGTTVGLCAFATERWARYSGPGITCLDQNPVLMGRTAASRLIARIYDGDSSPAERLEIPARLRVFGSTQKR